MKKSYIALLLISASISSNISAQFAWTQKANFGGSIRTSVAAFSIGNKGYFVGGVNVNLGLAYKDNWEYDPATNLWSQKASMNSASPRIGASAFAIGGYGYVGCGWTALSGGSQLNTFEKYDPSTNSWNSIANFPGSGRYTAIGVSDGTYGYVGLGYSPLTNDFYAYYPQTNTWYARPNFPGGVRQGAVAFSVGGLVYVGCGATTTYSINDLWEFNPATNVWTAKSAMPGIARDNAVAFAINGKGFIGSGYNYPTPYNNELYMYDPPTNSWTSAPSIPGGLRQGASAFTIGNIAYVGCGLYSPPTQCYDDFYAFVMSASIEEKNNTSMFNAYYDNNNQLIVINAETEVTRNMNFDIRIMDISGKLIFTKNNIESKPGITIPVNGYKNGVYIIEVKSSNKVESKRILITN